jgi:hypothetical protein
LPDGNADKVRKVALGCMAVFAVVSVIVLGGVWYLFHFVERRNEESERAYYTAAPGTKIFINENDAIPAELKDEFVPFAFHYPDAFTIVPDKNSFIRIERQENGATVARFAVTSLTVPSPKAAAGTIYPPLMNDLSKQLTGTNAGYREISQKAADFKSPHPYRDGWDMSWQTEAQNGPTGVVKFYGRILLLRDSARSLGVMVTMMEAAAADPAITRAADVGERGELAPILKSFRLLYTPPSHASEAQRMSRTRGIR